MRVFLFGPTDCVFLVPRVGIEPTRLSAGDFESPVYTSFTTEAGVASCPACAGQRCAIRIITDLPALGNPAGSLCLQFSHAGPGGRARPGYRNTGRDCEELPLGRAGLLGKTLTAARLILHRYQTMPEQQAGPYRAGPGCRGAGAKAMGAARRVPLVRRQRRLIP